jgi:acylpyruvate hydrolase
MKICVVRTKADDREILGMPDDDYILDLNAFLEPIMDHTLQGIPLTLEDFTGQRVREGIDPVLLIEEALGTYCVQPVIDPNEVTWLPPVNPSKIIAVGLNYRDHIAEQGLPMPEFPTIFAKFPSALNGHLQPIRYPEATQQLDYEVELAFVIGKTARNVPEPEAYHSIAGYMIMNDVTARDLQKSEKQWVRAKSFDTFAPCGPFFITADEVPNPVNLNLECKVNGEMRQKSNTRELIFDVPFLLSYLSHSFTLLPGDVITTGTPGGVGRDRVPPALLQRGDRIEMSIEGFGTLINWVE